MGELLAVTQNGSLPEQAAAAWGYYTMSAEGDAEDARKVADAATSDQLESELLLKFCRARTANMVATERFRTLARRVAAALLALGTLGGEHATEL
ncbi:MAG TPA: hypothetical protein VEO00_07095, partial [Actinomycetota bacterium]|nr:hypothetical protein [Actinomycetota bacterium]